jgi:general secretion pathway protein D
MNTKYYRIFFCSSSLTLLISACNYLPVNNAEPLVDIPPIVENNEEYLQEGQPEQETGLIANRNLEHRQAQQQILEMGNGQFIASPKPQIAHARETSDGDITLNFQDTDLREFIKAILGDVLGASYLIDPKVAGKVTIDTSRPVSKKELIPLLEEVLGMYAEIWRQR